MIVAYVIFCIVAILVGRFLYKNVFNPICLYSIVWLIAVLAHESGFIVYYELAMSTWLVIFVTHLLFVAGCWIGNIVECKKTSGFLLIVENEPLQRLLLKSIAITMSVSGIAILANFKTMISIYGLDLYGQLTDIYADRVEGLQTIETIPYLGAFIFVTIPLLGCYVKKYGFHIIAIPCVFFVCINSLISGGRMGIVFAMILFFAGFFCTKGANSFNQAKKNISLWICGASFAVMIIAVSQQRAAGIEMVYATDRFVDVFGNNVPLYKGLAYIAGPIGALNEYLKTCDFHFGENTFLTIYNLLAKFGLCNRISQYQEFFSTPSNCNVATWVRELVEDFTLAGALVFIPLFGIASAFFYEKAHKFPNLCYKVVWSVFSLVLILSFFDWKFRSSNIWIATIFGYLIGLYIDKNSIVSKSK